MILTVTVTCEAIRSLIIAGEQRTSQITLDYTEGSDEGADGSIPESIGFDGSWTTLITRHHHLLGNPFREQVCTQIYDSAGIVLMKLTTRSTS